MAGRSQTGERSLEDELKFELTAAQVRKLCRSVRLKAMQTAKPRHKTLRAIYFDTSDAKLFKRHQSLRVRKEGHHYVQCFKAKADGDISSGFARHEWEWRVPGPDLDVSLLRKNKAVKAFLKGVNLSKLTSIYSTDIKRQSRELCTPGGAVVQCEIDQGQVLTATTQVPLFELEMELKSGDVGELLQLARLITDIVPARLSNRTKAHRGHILAQGDGAPWIGAKHPSLPRTITAENLLRFSVMEGLKHLIANEDCVLMRTHPEGVHQMRIALRRMRSVITTYKKLLPKGEYESLSQGLKDVGAQLGPARDWDVFLDGILNVVEAGFEDDPHLALLRTRATQRRILAYEQVDDLIRSPKYARLLTDALVWAGDAPWRDAERRRGHDERKRDKKASQLMRPANRIAKAVLAKRHQRLLWVGEGLKTLSIEQRHRLRIAVKKARYVAQFFADLYPSKTVKPYLRALKKLQENLGHLNDLAMATRLMKELSETERGVGVRSLSHATGMVEGWHMHAQSVCEDELVKNWKHFCNVKTFW